MNRRATHRHWNNRLVSASVIAACLLYGLLQPVWHAAYAQDRLTSAASSVIESDPSGLTLVWSPPAFESGLLMANGQRYTLLRVPGLAATGSPGYPELPVYVAWVGLPHEGEARLSVEEIETDRVTLEHPPAPVPVPQAVPVASGGPALPPWTAARLSQRIPQADVYTQGGWYPDGVVRLGPPEELRGRRLAPLTIYPLRVNPVGHEMEVVRFLRVRITFTRPAAYGPPVVQQAEEDPFSQALRSTLLNPEALSWPPSARPSSLAAASQPAANGTNTIKVKVTQSGLYELSYNALQAAGMPVSTLDPRSFQLLHGYPRQEVAIQVQGESDGRFDPGDRILFYADPQFSRYVDYDIYFLTYGLVAQGSRMGSRSGNPDGLPVGTAWRVTHAEVNRYYDPLYPGRDGDHWYWDDLRQPDRRTGSYTLQLQTPRNAASDPAARLTLWLQGYTDPAADPDHRVSIAMNGSILGDVVEWNGKQAVRVTREVPAALLRDGDNTLTLSLPGAGTSIEGCWFDAASLSYAISQGGTDQLQFNGDSGRRQYTLTGWSGASLYVYDVTNPSSPRQVSAFQWNGSTLRIGDASTTPASYLVVPANRIRSPQALEPYYHMDDPAGGADYIIITHPDLATAANNLVQHRSARGLRAFSVDVRYIYDTFGTGRMDAEALRTFLQHAYASWPAPPPSYVLLMGDGSYDFKNYTGAHAPTLIPPYLAPVDPWWGETASDNRLVTFGINNLPSLAIGRLPANTPAQANAIVAKIIQYETAPWPGDWNAYHVFVADKPDDRGNVFYPDSDQVYHLVTSPYIGLRLYYGQGRSEPYFYSDASRLRADLRAHLDSGASIVTYNGHASWLQWAVDNFLDVDDVTQLRNGYRLPVVLEMTCFTSYFIHPLYPNTLDETLVRYANGGAIATWGGTGLGVASGHGVLEYGFYQAITSQQKSNLGAAVLAGKMALAATGSNLDLLDTYTLLGDPGLNINFRITPLASQAYLPLVLNK